MLHMIGFNHVNIFNIYLSLLYYTNLYYTTSVYCILTIPKQSQSIVDQAINQSIYIDYLGCLCLFIYFVVSSYEKLLFQIQLLIQILPQYLIYLIKLALLFCFLLYYFHVYDGKSHLNRVIEM